LLSQFLKFNFYFFPFSDFNFNFRNTSRVYPFDFFVSNSPNLKMTKKRIIIQIFSKNPNLIFIFFPFSDFNFNFSQFLKFNFYFFFPFSDFNFNFRNTSRVYPFDFFVSNSPNSKMTKKRIIIQIFSKNPNLIFIFFPFSDFNFNFSQFLKFNFYFFFPFSDFNFNFRNTSRVYPFDFFVSNSPNSKMTKKRIIIQIFSKNPNLIFIFFPFSDFNFNFSQFQKIQI
jgi:hypothetical protein